MRVEQAKAIAKDWVRDNAAGTLGFAGAFLHGSIVAASEDSDLAPSSDVDLLIVRDGPFPEIKPGKSVASGVILDVTDISWEDLGSPEQVLAQYHLAGSFRYPSVLADPSGRLRPLNEAVARRFSDRYWVRRRCFDARDRIERNLGSMSTAEQWHDRVISWLFGTGVMTHVVLVAGLRNPTVRTRYSAVRDLLCQVGRPADYERLLSYQGSAALRPEQVEHHLRMLEPLYDLAATVVRTPIFYATDISAESRVIAIDGSRELIERGDHREAVFWIVATFTRCLAILSRDAPEVLDQYRPGFEALLADLGIYSDVDLEARASTVRAALPWLLGIAEAVMDATPEIVGDDGLNREPR